MRAWTEEEIQFLKFAYPNKEFTLEEIVNELNRSKKSIAHKARRIGIKRYKEELPNGFQRCRRCKSILPLKCFYKISRNKTGFGSMCKACGKERKIIDTKQIQVTQVQVKKCTICNIEKNICEFSKNKKVKDGHLNQCKECRKKYERDRKVKNLKERGW